jgi:hypothetical protein
LRKFSRLYHVNATISRPQVAADDEIASWTIETKAADWQTRTSYDFLRFEDFIQRDLAQPIRQTVFHAVWIYWRLVFAGTLAASPGRIGASRHSSAIRISCCCWKHCAPRQSLSCSKKA